MGNETCVNFCQPPEQEISIGHVHIQMPPNTTRSIFEKTPRDQSLPGAPPELITPPPIPPNTDKLIRQYTIERLLGRAINEQPWKKEGNIYYRAVMPHDDETGAGIFIVKELESVYIGEFNRDYKCSGEGLLIAGDNSQYKGDFINGMAHGQGTLVENNITATGIWQNGVMTKGKIEGEGYDYQGPLQNGKPHGLEGHYRKGVYYFYQGSFCDGLYEGLGIQSSEKYIYNGEWKSGIKQGQGMIEYDDNSSYNGHWNEGKKDGQGIFISKTGQKWEGLWSQGHPEKGRWL